MPTVSGDDERCSGGQADHRLAVAAYRAVWHYTAGNLIVRARYARRSAEDRPTFRAQVFADLDAETYPRLAALGSGYLSLAAPDTYELGLDALIEGLLRDR
ncbi:hypothetical protein ACW9HJ_21510 [Nocardia gipuzkoensis]